jgi:CheY-like chemotaxis protein
MQQIFRTRDQYELLDAHSAELGLFLAIDHRPDLILLDLNLPGMNGYEVLSRLREHPDTVGIPVIAVTANAMPHDVARGELAGFEDYLTKPLDVRKLLSVVDRFVARA